MQLMGEKKQRENKEINKESNKERKLISLLGFSLMGNIIMVGILGFKML
jgi:hypothetical protein